MVDENNVDDGGKKYNIPNWIWIILGIILLLIGFGIFIRYYYATPVNTSIPPSSNEYQPTYAWGPTTTVPEALPSGYLFPVKKDSNGNLSLTPATLNQEVLDNPEQYGVTVTDPYPCIDIDELNAIQVTHTCNQYPTNFDRDLEGQTNCLMVDGGKAGPGESETYYAACDPNGQTKNTTLFCPGQVGGVAVNFNRTATTGRYDTLYCLKKDPLSNNVTADICDLSNTDFQFRIVLTTPRNWPSYGKSYGSTGMTGTLAAFIHRATGLCVDVLDPSVINSQGLTLRDCNETYNYGYTWQLFAPANLTCIFKDKTNLNCDSSSRYTSYQYDPSQPNNIGTSTQGCPIVRCYDIPSWNNVPIKDEDGYSTYSYTTQSPQQIVYIGYANGAEQTQSLKTNLEIASFFYQYNGMSLTYDGQGTLLTKPFARWALYYGGSPVPVINNLIYNSQIASFLTYNFIYGSIYSTPFNS